jgi:PPM family protein phosphatase
LRIEHGALSDQGKVRSSNEDMFVVNVRQGFFLVADGMGGHAAGEIASQITASAMEQEIQQEIQGTPDMSPEDLLKMAVQKANAQVYETQRLRPDYRGMGSTLTALFFFASRYYIAQVGDSRVYRYNDGILDQLTRDHSVVWPLYENGILTKDDISRHPQKNLITRSIGTHPQVEPDLFEGDMLDGDVFLLCSDGLTDVLSDQEIAAILTNRRSTPQELSELLVNAANLGGGPDNITVIVVRVIQSE